MSLLLRITNCKISAFFFISENPEENKPCKKLVHIEDNYKIINNILFNGSSFSIKAMNTCHKTK